MPFASGTHVAFRKKALALLGVVGISISRRRIGPTWDGSTLAISGLEPADIIHELAHWLVATPRERKMPEYGCGMSLFTSFESAKILNDRTDSFREENASVLGIAYGAAIGFPPDEIEFLLEEHNWSDSFPRHFWLDEYFWRVVVRLNRTGLMRGHLPTVGLRALHKKDHNAR